MMESISLKVKAQGYKLAAKFKPNSVSSFKKWQLNHASYQILTDYLVNKRHELGLPTAINKSLINDILRSKE